MNKCNFYKIIMAKIIIIRIKIISSLPWLNSNANSRWWNDIEKIRFTLHDGIPWEMITKMGKKNFISVLQIIKILKYLKLKIKSISIFI